ncbi:MAG: Pectate lyase [uncultured Chloroflexi bacterium]|uniref:Pectate lyase n=1 Tax=uncultured Chloroflexota bacterium TaxID=166587 RepID=A0A6J4HX01_9CHLR|nr:MAG: Pectate lyase [uncultured Chloroflexota bacterium]
MAGSQVAFTGAEGFGAAARGGRGGDVYHVTTLADTGAGSLRNGILTARGPRTIVFDVGGTIDLQSKLTISTPYLTLAGQTAPGDGITLRGWNTTIDKTHDVVVRYVRFRPGDVACPRLQDDALSVDKSKDIMLDHVSASWSIDEALSVTDSDRVTVQWSIISESLKSSCHEKGAHGYGSLLRYGSGGVTFHHNLFAHHDSRNPRAGDGLGVDFVNNVVYNWGMEAGYSGEASEGTTRVNYVSNYGIAGPSTRESRRASIFSGGSNQTQLFQLGNLIDSNRNGARDGTDTGWSMFRSSYTRRAERFDFPQVRADDARTAYERVLAGAGASRVRDAADRRIVADVANESGGLIDSQNQVGGWPELASAPAARDTDQDGMPDEWETQNGLNPNDPADRNRDAGGGVTMLERYLDSLAAS